MASIRFLQHVPFETPGMIRFWADKNGHSTGITRLYRNELLPQGTEDDFLIILGGPMGIYDEHQYPWLQPEKEYIKTFLKKGNPVLGICLGAQLLADCLGARVCKNPEPEIGWYPLNISSGDHPLSHIPEGQNVFHWHGDTFSLPEGSELLASSETTAHQAFLWKRNVLGLQFHMEITPQGVEEIVKNCRTELVKSPRIMPETGILQGTGQLKKLNSLYEILLDQLLSK